MEGHGRGVVPAGRRGSRWGLRGEMRRWECWHRADAQFSRSGGSGADLHHVHCMEEVVVGVVQHAAADGEDERPKRLPVQAQSRVKLQL